MSQRTWEWIGTKRKINRILKDNFGKNFDDNRSEYIKNQIASMINDFDNKYSRFDNNSLVCKINQERVLINIDIETMDIITQIIWFIKISDGYFDPFVWWDLERLGYDKDYSFKPKSNKSEYISNITKSKIKIKWNNIYISWNQKIDFGGIWKWYLIDKIGNFLENEEVKSYIINGWWDIYINDMDSKLGKIGIQNPLNTNEVVWYINTNHGAIASSGWIYRNWWIWLHHLINPKSHEPANDAKKSIHIYSHDIILADVASTTLFVIPIEKIDIYAKRFGVEFMVIYEDMTANMSKGFPFLWYE